VIRGVLFDLDGVLADTERLHWTAYRAVLLEHGVDVGLEEYRQRFIANGSGPEYACATYGLSMTPDELRAEKAPRYLDLLRGGSIRPCRGARDALARLRPAHRLAVATNAARVEVELILGALDLGALLDARISREDYRQPKPAPDAYLTAAATLGLTPDECVVVEDTARGVRAGRAAGMMVVAVPNDLTLDNDFTGSACRLGSLDELTPALLRELVAGTPSRS
jgi:HAD superfamily hydrolase (TIGR01509 family)